MPYLRPSDKRKIDRGGPMTAPGDLTYSLTTVLLHAPSGTIANRLRQEIDTYLRPIKHPRFADFAVVLGSLAATRLEYKRRHQPMASVACEIINEVEATFYREVVGPYEDTKIEENGDVYP